jgi:type VI protein secretion system component Hcp
MASKYFLVIDGLNGGSVDAQHVGWFDISGFDIDLSNALAAGGNAAGATK